MGEMSSALTNNFFVTVNALPNLQFYLTDASIPDMNIMNALVTTPVVDYPIHGDKLEFDPLNIGFDIDEMYHSYEELWNWVFAQQNPLHMEMSDIPTTDIYIDGLDNNKKPIVRWKFIDAFPISINGFTFNVKEGGEEELICSTQWRYTAIEFSRLVASNPPVTRKQPLPRIAG